MPFGSEQWMYSTGFYPYEIDQSLRFNDNDSAYLNRTPTSAGNRKTWTWSGWVKRGNIDVSGSVLPLFGAASDSNNFDYFGFKPNDSGTLPYSITFIQKISGSFVASESTLSVFRDASAWYHIVFAYDSGQATEADRIKCYVNGELQTFNANNVVDLNRDSITNSATAHRIGHNSGASTNYLDGYMAEVNFIDGQALDATDFGEFKSGVWIPKSYSGTYGTNGFYLPFKNATITNETDSATITAPFGGTAANGKETDGNFVTSNTTTGSGFVFIHYDLGSAKSIGEYVIKALSFTGGVSTFQVEYSSDNSSWVSATSISVTSSAQDFAAGWNDVTARYWRLRATAFGTNGTASVDSFQLFSGEIGIDDSGNGNNFSSRRVLPADIVPDSPTNNFATLNPLFQSLLTYSEGNLRFYYGGAYAGTEPTMYTGKNQKYYSEELIVARGGDKGIAVISEDGIESIGWVYNGNTYGTLAAGFVMPSYTTGDIIGYAVDGTTNQVQFYKNGVAAGSAWQFSTAKPISFRTHMGYMYGGSDCIANFGQDSSFAGNKTAQGNTDANGIGDFYYAPPAGYLALCTANLPDPAIDPAQDDVPADYFNTVLYTGDGTYPRSVTGVGFQPDFTWIKARSVGYSHTLYDAVRGTGTSKMLFSDLTNAEGSLPQNANLSSFDADGFGLGSTTSTNILNNNGTTFVAWNWLAGNGTTSNTDGTITSTVSANEKAGFSIVTFTTDGTNTNVGTGLSSSKPLDMVVIKRRDSTSEWQVGHRFSGQGSNFAYHLELNSTAALSGSAPYFMATQSSSNGDRIYLASGTYGVSSATWVAYCFQSVEGYSKFGSYTGNGSIDGPFVYTGFRPAFLLIKRASVSGNYWVLTDSARGTYNVMGPELYPNASDAEGTGQSLYDYTSNGFKMRNNFSALNNSGDTYIYMAFAEMPFKYSNAR